MNLIANLHNYDVKFKIEIVNFIKKYSILLGSKLYYIKHKHFK